MPWFPPFLSFDRVCGLCNSDSGPHVLCDSLPITVTEPKSFYPRKPEPAFISLMESVSCTLFPHHYCLLSNMSYCKQPLPLISCLEMESDRLTVQCVFLWERLWTSHPPPFFFCFLIVADSFLLIGASKITWSLSLFCLPLARTQNIRAGKLWFG